MFHKIYLWGRHPACPRGLLRIAISAILAVKLGKNCFRAGPNFSPDDRQKLSFMLVFFI